MVGVGIVGVIDETEVRDKCVLVGMIFVFTATGVLVPWVFTQDTRIKNKKRFNSFIETALESVGKPTNLQGFYSAT